MQLVVCCTQYDAGRLSGNGGTLLPDHRLVPGGLVFEISMTFDT